MTLPIPIEEDLGRLNRILREALLALASRGAAEESCRLAARAWSALRDRHGREAARLTALLHVLSRDTPPISHQGVPSHE